MSEYEHGCSLSGLTDIDPAGTRLVTALPSVEDRLIRSVQLVTPGEAVEHTDASTLLVILPGSQTDDQLSAISALLAEADSASIACWLPDSVNDEQIRRLLGRHAILRLGADIDATTFVSDAVRALRPAEQVTTQRLASLQRSMTQALNEPEPLKALTLRLAKACNAVAAIIGAQGELETSSGPLPLSLLLKELKGVADGSRPFALEGWRGIAVRVTPDELPAGWFLIASRRLSFPDPYAIAAAHIAASLAETHLRVELLIRRQERAVRSSFLEQLLSLRRQRENPELSGKLSALGLDFEGREVRVFSLGFASSRGSDDHEALLETLYKHMDVELTRLRIPHLLTARNTGIVALAQLDVETAAQAAFKIGALRQGMLLGVGRMVESIDEIADSHNDSVLAIRTLRGPGRTTSMMSYDDFDFAMRLFSDAGLDRMGRWATEMLEPLADQHILLEGLKHYFEHGFNIIAAAKSLKIHHNTLRYRLTRVEEVLQISLRDPAAVSSLFLALTARSMIDGAEWRQPTAWKPDGVPSGSSAPSQVVRSTGTGSATHPPQALGVVYGPER
ncbi:PucR family transcriptional regulator [Saccharopolyspora karakumensis]|uniref:PucR family transcriptional regulator n=1 Tax=Saccharopolyspora karakumensis TaxID=2530386 RepID=A0A4R5BMJ9_9PSEU|nr:helix-turn-helix domain-containing protein [Saccharopolyspora karakumensis]TDD87059.1 PucR family transcriptional regulator [Saccharopolyspora karakumensis]